MVSSRAEAIAIKNELDNGAIFSDVYKKYKPDSSHDGDQGIEAVNTSITINETEFTINDLDLNEADINKEDDHFWIIKATEEYTSKQYDEYLQREREKERIREAKIKAAEEAKREKARQQELQAKKEKEEAEKQAYFDEISKYKYGTKDRPIVKEIILYSLVSEIGLRLDFGKGVRVRAVRGNLNCTDVFGDRVISEKVEDKQVRINNNKEDRYHSYKYEYRRPLDSVHNLAVFEIMDTRTLRAGGIEECSFIPTKVVE